MFWAPSLKIQVTKIFPLITKKIDHIVFLRNIATHILTRKKFYQLPIIFTPERKNVNSNDSTTSTYKPFTIKLPSRTLSIRFIVIHFLTFRTSFSCTLIPQSPTNFHQNNPQHIFAISTLTAAPITIVRRSLNQHFRRGKSRRHPNSAAFIDDFAFLTNSKPSSPTNLLA